MQNIQNQMKEWQRVISFQNFRKHHCRNSSEVISEPFTIDGEHHLNYRSILDLTESEIPAAQVELLKAAVISNTELVDSKLNEIIEFVKSIPGSYEGYEIISEPRREYYLKSFITRFEDVLKKRRGVGKH